MCECYIVYLISIVGCVCNAEYVFCNKILHVQRSALYDFTAGQVAYAKS
jgi:hypothetical protein